MSLMMLYHDLSSHLGPLYRDCRAVSKLPRECCIWGLLERSFHGNLHKLFHMLVWDFLCSSFSHYSLSYCYTPLGRSWPHSSAPHLLFDIYKHFLHPLSVFFSQAEQTQVTQSFLVREMVQDLNHLLTLHWTSSRRPLYFLKWKVQKWT